MILLRNFDTYLSVMLGKAIQIKDFNQKTGEDKYQISGKTAKLATTWRVSENIFVEEEADTITKLAINTSPLYNWGSTVPKEGYFLNFSNFQHIIAKIKDLTYNIDTDNIIFNKAFSRNYKDLYKEIPEEIRDKSLRTLINVIRRNPRKYLHSIFNILSTVILFPFGNTLVFLAEKIIKGPIREQEAGDYFLDERLLGTPYVAVQTAMEETIRIGEMACWNVQRAVEALFEKDEETASHAIIKKRKTRDASKACGSRNSFYL